MSVGGMCEERASGRSPAVASLEPGDTVLSYFTVSRKLSYGARSKSQEFASKSSRPRVVARGGGVELK